METSNKISTTFKIVIALLVFAAIGGVASTGFIWLKFNELASQIEEKTEEQGSEAEMKEIVGKIEKFMELPQDEKPSLLTITDNDLAGIQGQAFFANVLSGDKLLVYTKHSKAILWRPTSQKVIQASIINLAPQGPAEN